MANPRKFSEKIALHNQKQAEGNAAFDAIMREVTETTRIGPAQPGSLPNVSSRANNFSVDLQGALMNLEAMKQQAMGHHHYPPDYGQHVLHARQMHHASKRADYHTSYNSSFLTLPQDSSWRRSNSDSALHASAVGSQNAVNGSSIPNGSCSVAASPSHCAPVENGFAWHNVEVKREYDYRPKSCEVSDQNCSMYPPLSPVPLPVPNNTGSLPDLSSLHFPSPLATPLDGEEQACYSLYASARQACAGRGGHATSSLNAPPSHIGAMRSASPVHRRRHGHAVPSPLVLHGSQHGDMTPSPIMSPYRRSPSDSPTSPLSQRSYSPALSPMMPASPLMPPAFPDAYYLQQQLSQTSSLQQQFEQFNMGGSAVHQDGGGGVYGGQHLMPTGAPGCADYYQKNYFSRSPLQASSPPQQASPMTPRASPFFPLSPYHHRKAADAMLTSEPYPPYPSPHHPSLNSKLHIPDIILTGVDESFGRQDFARELGHAMAGVPESFDHQFNCFDAEAARIGLDPLDTDSLQMLSDPYGMVADPATEDSFRLGDSRQHTPCCTAPL